MVPTMTPVASTSLNRLADVLLAVKSVGYADYIIVPFAVQFPRIGIKIGIQGFSGTTKTS